MIISASRRTDIPAFYGRWMANRLREGFCAVPNPYNRNSVARVSLSPQDVDAIVFWTRWPRPFFRFLEVLEALSYRFYFQFTVLGYPRAIDPGSPAISRATEAFRELSVRVSPDRVIWRYDPIVISDSTPVDYHVRQFDKIAATLEGSTKRCVLSLVDPYKKSLGRVRLLDGTSAQFRIPEPDEEQTLLTHLAAIARSRGMEPTTCAEERDFGACGVAPGKCVDDGLIQTLWGFRTATKKDPNQRSACGCVKSQDIGMYDSCNFGCTYCYATSSFKMARRNFERHDPDSPSLIGRYLPSSEPQGSLFDRD